MSSYNSREKFIVESKALIYPRCFVKKKIGSLLSLFFKEIMVLCPTEMDMDKIGGPYFKDFSLQITPWIPNPMGKEAAKDLEAGIKALTTWGEQLGLGQNVSFETIYSALSASQDSEVQAVMDALKGKNRQDLITAARAFLSLSLESDKREDELDTEIEKVEKQAQKISQLVEDSTLLPEAEAPIYFVKSVSKARERLRAWVRLAFSRGSVPVAWPIGESIDVKDLMDSAYESLSGGISALDVLDVYLPLEEKVLRDENLIFKTRSIFSDILSLMTDTCHGPALTADKEFFDLSKALADAVDSPKWEQAKGPRLVLSLYPGYSWQQIMVQAAKVKEEEILLTEDETQICASFFIL